MQYQYYREILHKNLDDYRYNHSLCVADEAKRLAVKYGADEERAYLAGLLHDITKNFSSEQHLKIFSDFDIMLSDIENNAHKIWHSISGAAYVENVLKIDDKELISSIRYHTTGKSNMTLLELIIFVADFTSSDRNYPDVSEMRRLADSSLEDAAIYALTYTINDLKSKGAKIHPDTLSALDYLLDK